MRDGTEGRLPRAKDDEGRRIPQHTLGNVYREMMIQVCMDYPGLPDVRTLTLGEIRFFYDGLRETLKKHSAPKKK